MKRAVKISETKKQMKKKKKNHEKNRDGNLDLTGKKTDTKQRKEVFCFFLVY